MIQFVRNPLTGHYTVYIQVNEEKYLRIHDQHLTDWILKEFGLT